VGANKSSYVRLMDSCITQLKTQRDSRNCSESKEEGEASVGFLDPRVAQVSTDERVAQVSQSKGVLVDALHKQGWFVDALYQ
jgi:hypothetical protein